jgi:hypothetical protein
MDLLFCILLTPFLNNETLSKVDYRKINFKKYIKVALKKAHMGIVTTQAQIIFLKRLQSTLLLLSVFRELWSMSDNPFANPMITTDPTLQCVDDIGNPILLANKTVDALPISIVKPLKFKFQINK